MNSKNYRVFMGNIPLTEDIADKERADLAYNICFGMSQADTLVTVNGKEQPIYKSKLCVVDSDGNSHIPALDEEWFGTEEQNDKERERILDIIVKDMEEDLKNDGLDMEPDRDFERSLMDQYTVSYREYGTATVFFMPESWDIDKARDAYSILTTDMEKSVQFSMDTKYDGKLTFDPKNFSVTDMEG